MDNNSNDLVYWVWLSNATQGSPMLANTLLKFFGGVKEIHGADEEALKSVRMKENRLELLLDKDLSRAEQIIDYCAKNSIGIATMNDYFYPQKLRSLVDRPVLLYYLGNFIDFDSMPCVAVVGTRKPSDYAVVCAKRISLDLARAGIVTVSGLASGVDSCAHKASVFNESLTVGVLGSGIDVIYPKENAELYHQVAQGGLILTEYPPSTPPLGRNFPQRNRIIAALANITVVVEGSERSGALITAEHTLRQKKPLYSVPGSIFNPGCAGSNFLLTVGAQPLLGSYNVIQDMEKLFPDKVRYVPQKDDYEKKPTKEEKRLFSGKNLVKVSQAKIPPVFDDSPKKEKNKADNFTPPPSITELSEQELKIYTKLGQEPLNPNELAEDDLPIKTVLKILTALEIKGYVTRHPGAKFSTFREE